MINEPDKAASKQPLNRLHPSQTALILLDGQNDFLTKGGVLFEAINSARNGEALSDSLNQAIGAARGAGAMIINTRIIFDPGYPEAGPNPYGIFAAVGRTGGFIRGTWGAGTAESLDIRGDDIVLEKHGMSAFLNSDLERILKRRGVKTLVLAGCLTDACVESTMRNAYDRSFEVYCITDATATLDAIKHEETIKNSYPLFSKALTVDEFAQSVSLE